MELLAVNGKIDWKLLCRNVLIPVAGGTAIGYLANTNTRKKYEKLEKPSFSPPGAVFPIAWTALYTLMGTAKYRVKKKQELHGLADNQSVPYNVQLGLNFLWSFLYFKWNLRGTALVDVFVLLGAIVLTAYEFYQTDATAGTLMLPYIAWVLFAFALNYSTWRLNK